MPRAQLLILTVLLAACGGDAETASEAPPTTAVAPIAGARLADALELLDRELAAAIRADMNDDGLRRFVRAEAITDRLLETQYPFAWLRAGSYSLDAKLRQIQSLADRITAQLSSKAPHETLMEDVRLLRRSVLQLRADLTQGGGAAPPSLERLLAGRDTLNLIGAEGAGGE